MGLQLKFLIWLEITTSKQQKFSQSDPVLIRQFSKKLPSDPILIRKNWLQSRFSPAPCSSLVAVLHCFVHVRSPADRCQCCQPCVFPANLGLFFCGFAGFFEDLRDACFGACFD